MTYPLLRGARYCAALIAVREPVPREDHYCAKLNNVGDPLMRDIRNYERIATVRATLLCVASYGGISTTVRDPLL